MSKPFEYEDKPQYEVYKMINEELGKHPNTLFFIKWTCPNCGDRVTSNDPNQICTKGYRHEDCGFIYGENQDWKTLPVGLLAILVAG